MKRNRKWKIRHIVFDGRILCFSWYKNRKLKVKVWWVGACERKKRAFFVPLILSEGNFLNICVLSQCIVNWIHFPNIYAFIYQKTLLHTLSWLFLKSTKYLQFILTFVQFQSKMKWRAELLTIMALYLSMNILTHPKYILPHMKVWEWHSLESSFSSNFDALKFELYMEGPKRV